MHITYIGGPTAIVEIGGQRFLTDPTFDAAGSEFRSGSYVLRKEQGAALTADEIGHVDAVLLSHDHHFDNLDGAGRRFVEHAARVLTTEAAATRLGPQAEGLPSWQSAQVGSVTVTATPARHGPAHADRGPVIGFVLASADAPDDVVYISGDTVWYEGVAEVALRFRVKTAVLFMGAAQVEAVGPWHLTFTASEGVEAACAFADAAIVPLHFEGWEHFREHRREIDGAFASAGLSQRLRWLTPGVTQRLR